MKKSYRGNFTLYLVQDGEAKKVDNYRTWFDAAEVLWFFLKDDNSNG